MKLIGWPTLTDLNHYLCFFVYKLNYFWITVLIQKFKTFAISLNFIFLSFLSFRMSDNPSNQVNTGVYGQLLGLATAAQGGRETDKSVNPLSDDERRWLDDAIQTFTKQADPIAHMKRGLAKLKTINLDEEDPEVLKEKLEVPVVELLDLVCDLDLALDFCTLGGVAILDDIFAKNKDISTCTILPLVTEIAQNNPPVQKVLLKSLFLEKTLNIFKDPLSSDTTKTRAVSAISCIVKQFPPAVM